MKGRTNNSNLETRKSPRTNRILQTFKPSTHFIKSLRKLLSILTKNIISDHQFVFRMRHGTVERIHRVVKKICKSIKEKQYCSVAILGIAQAFDKVWHEGLLYKLKKILPRTFYEILQS